MDKYAPHKAINILQKLVDLLNMPQFKEEQNIVIRDFGSSTGTADSIIHEFLTNSGKFITNYQTVNNLPNLDKHPTDPTDKESSAYLLQEFERLAKEVPQGKSYTVIGVDLQKQLMHPADSIPEEESVSDESSQLPSGYLLGVFPNCKNFYNILGQSHVVIGSSSFHEFLSYAIPVMNLGDKNYIMEKGKEKVSGPINPNNHLYSMSKSGEFTRITDTHIPENIDLYRIAPDPEAAMKEKFFDNFLKLATSCRHFVFSDPYPGKPGVNTVLELTDKNRDIFEQYVNLSSHVPLEYKSIDFHKMSGQTLTVPDWMVHDFKRHELIYHNQGPEIFKKECAERYCNDKIALWLQELMERPEFKERFPRCSIVFSEENIVEPHHPAASPEGFATCRMVIRIAELPMEGKGFPER